MKVAIISSAALAMALLAAAPGQAITVLSLVDASTQNDTPYSFSFTASGGATRVTFEGYQVPDLEIADVIRLTAAGGSTNLLSPTWTYHPAATNPAGFQFGNTLAFLGGAPSIYDRFDQVISTAGGSSYALTFTYSNNVSGSAGVTSNAPSGFRVSVAAVPEPATWAMMLAGFGLLGAGMRRRRLVEKGLDALR